MNLLKLLTLITKYSGKIPQLMTLINAIIALFADEIEAAVPSGGLQATELSAEEAVLVEQIMQALTESSGTQAVLDLAKLRQFAKWLDGVASSPIGKLLISFLGGI